MKCPTCGFIQNDSEECVKCGVIIEKYLQCIKRRSNRLSEPAAIKENDFSQRIISILKTSMQVAQATCLNLKTNQINKNRIFGLPGNLFEVLRNAAGSKNACVYKRRLWDQVMQIVLTAVLTILLNAGLLFLCNMLWRIYCVTPVGRQFANIFAERAQMISAILSRDLIRFSIDLTLAALSVCIFISMVCQFFHISRYLYHSRGFWGKFFLWGGSITAAVAVHIEPVYEFDDFSMAYSVALIPTLCLFSSCFESANRLIPEIGDLIEKTLSLRARLFM